MKKEEIYEEYGKEILVKATNNFTENFMRYVSKNESDIIDFIAKGIIFGYNNITTNPELAYNNYGQAILRQTYWDAIKLMTFPFSDRDLKVMFIESVEKGKTIRQSNIIL